MLPEKGAARLPRVAVLGSVLAPEPAFMPVSFPPEVEAADELFWRRQEARKRGLLGQPCCTQSKMSWALMDIPGDFAVVIHGEYDCLNCFHHHLGPSAHQFFSTRLSDHQLTTGETQGTLERLLRLLVAERAPQAIVVLGTCPVEVIGDRFEVVAEAVARDTGTPILAMHTSGLALTSLTDCQDWLFDSLASLPQEPVDGAARRVNLLGLPAAHPEPVAVLGAVGVDVGGFLPHGASLGDWRRVGAAAATAAVDARLWPRLTARLAEAHGQPLLDVPLPVGVEATMAFYRTVGEALGVAAALEAHLEAPRAAAQARVEAWRARHGGARCAMAIRVLNTAMVDRIAMDGLGDLAHLQELGFEVELLVQGPPEEGPRFAERIRERGVALPVRTFGGPFELGAFLSDGGYDVCYVPDSNRNIAARAGLPMISSRSLQPWLAGVDDNLATLAGLVQAGREAR